MLKRRPAFLLSAAASAVVLMALLAPAAVAAMVTTSGARANGFRVSGGTPVVVAGMMPGDRTPTQTIELRASGSVRYRLRVEYTGSELLAGGLVMTVLAGDGSELYRGSLTDASAGGTGWPSSADLALADGGTATISLWATLPIDAPNGIQGARLEFSLIVQSFEDTGGSGDASPSGAAAPSGALN
jgi:hypothetical protein